MELAGYSLSPQAKKLGIKPGCRLAFDQSPDGWSLQQEPANVTVVGDSQPADVLIGFFHTASDLPVRLPELSARIFPAGSLWIAWPRRAGGHQSDITDNVVREHALPLGIVDVKVAAMDQDWSALKFVWRVELRS